MKKILLCVIAVVALVAGVQAQSNPFIGKWKIAKIETPQGTMNLENRDSLRMFFMEAMKKETGAADSTQINAILDGIMSSVGDMVIDFKNDGTTQVNMSKSKVDKQGYYKVDTQKSTISQSDKKEEAGKTETYKVVGETIVINSSDGIVTLKKVKG